MLDFAGYYGFVPRVCRPYRPETKGKIESTIRFIKGNFWPGFEFDSLKELNRQALVWCGEVNRRVHATTREIPQVRFPQDGLTPLNGQPAYDTSYVSHRQVAKDCRFSYRGNRYSVPHAYAGKSVLVRERYEKGSIILTSNKSYGDWGAIFADNVIASAILDRLLHHSTTINIKGESYRLKDKKKAGVVAAKLPGKEGA